MWFAISIFLGGFVSVVEAGWAVTDDRNILDKNYTPVLGRGYSAATGGFHSVCLEVDGITDSTCDYDYQVKEFLDAEEMSGDLGGIISMSASFSKILRLAISSDDPVGSLEASAQTHRIYTFMTVDRYYSSLDETESGFVDAIDEMLAYGNLVNFFQACGPSYIRSISKRSEVTTEFSYTSTSRTADGKFNDEIILRAQNSEGGSPSGFENLNSNAATLKIWIEMYGLSVSAAAEDTLLIASDLEDYRDVMDSGFQGMMDPSAGYVQSIEILPWTENSAFYNAVELDITPSRMSYACRGEELGCTDGVDCGYDQDGNELHDHNLCEIIGTEDLLYKDVRKHNLLANAEFLVRADKVAVQQVLEAHEHLNCVSELMQMHRSWDYKYLVNHNLEYYGDDTIIPSVDVRYLRHFLLYGLSVPVQDLNSDPESLLADDSEYFFARKSKKLRNYLNSFLTPCMQEFEKDSDGLLHAGMQLKHWTEIPVCNKIMCIFPCTQWDDATSDCLPFDQEFTHLVYRSLDYCPPLLEDDVKGDIAWHGKE